MGTRCIVNLSGLRNIEKMFHLSKPLLDECAEIADSRWSAQMKGAFASEGASTGDAWAPLSPRYKAWKEGQRALGRQKNRALIAAYRSGKSTQLKQHQATSTRILVLSGVMRDDFSFRESPGHIAEAALLSPKKGLIRLGARGPGFYKFHVWGTRHMPRRDPLRRTSAQMQHVFDGIIDRIRQHFVRALRARDQAGY